MRILIVHNYYKIPGGEDTVVDNESRLLSQKGHKVYFYKRNNEEMAHYGRLRKLMLPIDTIFSLKSYKEVLDIIDMKKIDIVHVHNTVCVISPSIYYAAFKRGVPVVQTIHNFRLICPGASLSRNGKICEECAGKSLFHAARYGCYRNSRMNTFAVATMESIHKWIGTYHKLNYICLTEFNKKQLLKMNARKEYINPDNVYVKPNFVVCHREMIPFNKRKNQIVYAGRLDPTKGIRLLFHAWKAIDEYELIVCGTGPEEAWCKKFIKNSHISNIQMLGFVPNSEVIEIIADSKALILPTQWYEGFPMVLVESFSCGTPVLGSDIGNVNDIIVEGQNGLHFNHASAKDMVRAVKQLGDMCSSTREVSQTFYSAEANYGILMNIYNRCTNGGK